MKRPRFDVYESRDGWRWRLIAANGRIIADSGEAYTRKHGCERAITTAITEVEKIGHARMIKRIQAGAITNHFHVSGKASNQTSRQVAASVRRQPSGST